MNIVVPNEREHITILTTIAANGDAISNYYVVKGARVRSKYIALYEEGATMGMHKRAGWTANYSYNGWTTFYIL